MGPAAPHAAAGPRAFVAFAGGGAKGIAHVGALSALERREVRIAGFSGTSAGAIVATLAAAGFRSHEIIHPDEPRSILELLCAFDESLREVTDLFGPSGWAQVSAARALHRAAKPRVVVGTIMALVVAVAMSAVSLGLYGFPVGVLILALWLVLVTVGATVAVSALLGLAKLHTLRDALAKLLSHKLFADKDTAVLFRHFDGKANPALKIVAANISDRRLELFSADTTPDVEVADAVAASICLPLIFDLWNIGDRRYVDGGVVSNLPAWPFDEERALAPDAMTIAFAIGEPASAEAPAPVADHRLAWLPSLVETTLTGSVALSLRAVGPSELITLRPRIGLMDFDLGSEKTREVLANMTAAALAEIDERLFAFPDAYREACRRGVELAKSTLDRAPYTIVGGAQRGRIRVAVAFQPEGYVHALRLRFGANFEDDADQDLTLPIQGSLVGVAWQEGQAQFDIAPFPADLCLPGEDLRPIRRLIWKDLAWSLRVPILSSEKRRVCVVTVDGSDRLRDTPETREVFEGLADEIIGIFKPVVERLGKAGADGTT